MINRQVVLASWPKGVAQAEHFAIRDAPVAAPAEGQIRVRNEFLSVEPAMRGWIADRGNYSAAVEIGSAMRALAVGEIVESRHPDYRRGEIVAGWFGWQETATVDVNAVVRRVAEADLRRSLALGVLGINGVSALVGLTVIGEPQRGETVLVSTAAGAVGSAVGQIAKILGCRTVGVAGGPEKVAQCRDPFGYDAAVDHKAAGIDEALPVADGASDRTPSARQARPSAGVRGIRSQGSLRGVGSAPGRLGAFGPASLSGRDSRRSRELSRRARRALSRREQGQAPDPVGTSHRSSYRGARFSRNAATASR